MMECSVLAIEHLVSSVEISRYRRHAIVAHNLAQAATDSVTAAIHVWLAQKYERLADQCEAEALLPNEPIPFPSVHEPKTNIPI